MDMNEEPPLAVIAIELGLSSADLLLDDVANEFIHADQVSVRKNIIQDIEASYRLKSREWIDVTIQIQEARASSSFNPNLSSYRDFLARRDYLRSSLADDFRDLMLQYELLSHLVDDAYFQKYKGLRQPTRPNALPSAK